MDLEKLINQINTLRLLANVIEPYWGELSICIKHKNLWNSTADKLEKRLPYGYN